MKEMRQNRLILRQTKGRQYAVMQTMTCVKNRNLPVGLIPVFCLLPCCILCLPQMRFGKTGFPDHSFPAEEYRRDYDLFRLHAHLTEFSGFLFEANENINLENNQKNISTEAENCTDDLR